MKKTHIALILFVLFIVLIASQINGDIPLQELKQKYTNSASKFIEVDGMQVHYRDEGKGMPVVLVHGTAASLHTWDEWAAILKKKYRVIRMDLPAFGLTGPHPKREYSINSYTNFLHQFLLKIKVDSTYLAGNSLGGNIAWNYAANHPTIVKKLVLIDASGYPSTKAPSMIFKIAKKPVINNVIGYFTPKAIIKKNLEAVYFDDTKVTDKLVTRYHDLTLRKGNRQAFIDKTKTNFTDHTAKLKTISVKTLILWGENDQWISTDIAKKFKQDISNSTMILMPNTGHLPMEENPKKSLRYVSNFFEEL